MQRTGCHSFFSQRLQATLTAILLLAVVPDVLAQTNEPKLWTRAAASPPGVTGVGDRWVEVVDGAWFALNTSAFRTVAARTPREDAATKASWTEFELPKPDGSIARFRIAESPVMAPELAARYPSIKTYAGEGIDDPGATIRLDFSPSGLHAQVLSPGGIYYVDPAVRGDTERHVSYWRRDLRRGGGFQCLVGPDQQLSQRVTGGSGAARTVSGDTLRTYRIAVGASGEYTAFFGGTVEAGLAAIVTAVNRVNGIYEQELAVRLVLVANNDQVVFTDPNFDPYTGSDIFSMIEENQGVMDFYIGSGNYDIGHVVGVGDGGVAQLGCVCDPAGKAKGGTALTPPVGDAFYVDYVAHEVGHQFGANHTFNSTSGSCGGGNRAPATAFEPGSGSTIMAYAGICSGDNLQLNSDPYFHAGSIEEIRVFVAGGGGDSCAVNTATGNSAPVVNAGPDYVIPANTPFLLTASATDPNGHPMTYCWEEMDLGPAAGLTAADNGSSPLFRSMLPTSSPTRYFPKLSSVVANTNWNQEMLPALSRSMQFRVTVRDNQAGGGGVADDDMLVTVVSSAGPFTVTSPNSAVTWTGSPTVTWNVAGTSGSPINAANVDIFLSIDGGLTFPYQLATNVPNSGSRVVTLPSVGTTQARIKVQAAGNIFYDISNVNFTIIPSGPFVQLTGMTLVSESCTPTNGLVDPYELVTMNCEFSNVGTAPTTDFKVTLLQTNGVYMPSGQQTIGVVPAGGSVSRPFSFVAGGVCGGWITNLFKFADGGTDMGVRSQERRLGLFQSTVVTQVFDNLGSITIPLVGTASPYPSTILVSGVTNPVVKVTARLNGFGHGYPSDLAVLLVGPNGNAIKLMDECGGDTSVGGLNMTFDDEAPGSLSAVSPLTSGTFRPTDFVPDGGLTGTPQPPYASTFAPLAATPNGAWSLYIEDFYDGDSGSVSGGWTLRVISSNSVATCCSTLPPTTFTSTTYSNNAVHFSWSAVPGPNYQVQYRTNLTVGSWQNLGSPIPGTNSLLRITDGPANGPMRFYRVVTQP